MLWNRDRRLIGGAALRDTESIVSTVVGLQPPLDRPPELLLRAEGGVAVVLRDRRRVLLDPLDPRSEGFAYLLDELGRSRLPVYVDVDKRTETLKGLHIPHITRVIGAWPRENGDLAVGLEASQAVHVVPRDSRNHAELKRRLRAALELEERVAVTADFSLAIIDVRDLPPGADGELPPPQPPAPPPFPEPDEPTLWQRGSKRLRQIYVTIIRTPLTRKLPPAPVGVSCVSSAVADRVFAAMRARSCSPHYPPYDPTCIPFLYPDGGCNGRAHEMCRLMIGMGITPRKVWIRATSERYGLWVNTPNSPRDPKITPPCQVSWLWHVAPILCVETGGRWHERQWMVIDPSLFSGPVSLAVWEAAMNSASAVVEKGPASDFAFLGANNDDPYYVRSTNELYRNRCNLYNRTVQLGPPPYC